MNRMEWEDQDPAVEIDRLLITWRGMLGLAVVVAVLLPGLGLLIAGIILAAAYAKYRWAVEK